MSKFENFVSALDNLADIYNYSQPYGNVELSGMVALFEICFEQSWKTMKELLDRDGYREGKTGSPKLIIRTAYAAGMIPDEELWLRALEDRNHVAHAYNEAIALSIVQNTKDSYYEMFRVLRETLERDWFL
ncbi:MAG: nucleotidyltransferase substrate binding protein [Oscillibacter sp.]|nr:nucleotidyltransferase substrate binding protein [Oscillibacter sp.]